jgi:hypothetical protein
MLMDFIRSMRKDRLEYLGKKEKESKASKGQENRGKFKK